MVEYKSALPELGFYVEGKHKKFRYGKYKAETKAEMEVLDKLAGVEKIQDPEFKSNLEKFMEKESKEVKEEKEATEKKSKKKKAK